jgi:hypothetical protein
MKFVLVVSFSFVWLCIILIVVRDSQQEDRIKYLENNQCNCTVNINGSIMSVEDGFYYVLEGLSVDQADEVQIMINNSVKER